MQMVKEEQIEPTTTPKRIKCEEEDRISLLPDCLILEIISRLCPTGEAIKTGTLSKRWRHLWPYVHNLSFLWHHTICMSNRDMINYFIPLVNKTLMKCHQLNIDKFQIHIMYNDHFQSHLNSWIHYAINRKVQHLDISVDDFGDHFVLDELIFLSSSIKHLKLNGCNINPVAAISWNKLKSLYLSDGRLDEGTIQNILSGSPLLETLELDHCYGNCKRIDITSKSVRNFLFSGYYSQKICAPVAKTDIMEINAPNILSLKIQGRMLWWKLLLLDVSSLVKVGLDYWHGGKYVTPIDKEEVEEDMLKGFIMHLRHVKELEIRDLCLETLARLKAKDFVLPSNMKYPDITSPVCSDGDRFIIQMKGAI